MARLSEREIRTILKRLEAHCPAARTALRHKNPFELLVATILSAQCTDKRVNMITPALFQKFPTPQAMAVATVDDIIPFIKTCGLYRTKAKSLAAMAEAVVKNYGGRIPEDRDEMMKLQGVGRKTANVVASQAFSYDAIAVDTHVFRVASRIGLTHTPTPEKTEFALMKVIPQAQWSRAHHWIIHHGRTICKAPRPRCDQCFLIRWCQDYKRRQALRHSPSRAAGGRPTKVSSR